MYHVGFRYSHILVSLMLVQIRSSSIQISSTVVKKSELGTKKNINGQYLVIFVAIHKTRKTESGWISKLENGKNEMFSRTISMLWGRIIVQGKDAKKSLALVGRATSKYGVRFSRMPIGFGYLAII